MQTYCGQAMLGWDYVVSEAVGGGVVWMQVMCLFPRLCHLMAFDSRQVPSLFIGKMGILSVLPSQDYTEGQPPSAFHAVSKHELLV